MLFGFLLFASCPKPTWSEPYTPVISTPSWTAHFTKQGSIDVPEAALQNQQRLTISNTKDAKSFSWLPTHEDIWTSNKPPFINSMLAEKQYATWSDDSVRLLLRHNCSDNDLLHWKSTSSEGSILATEFTILTISRAPYSKSIPIQWSCGTSQQTTHTKISLDNSLPLPHIQWRWLNAQTLRVISLDATESTLSILHGNTNVGWTVGDTAFIAHPLSVWDVDTQSIPSTHLKFELSAKQTVLYTSTPISMLNPALSVTRSNDQTYLIDTPTDSTHIVYSRLIGQATSEMPNLHPVLTQKPISDDRLFKGLYWLSVQDPSRQSHAVEPLWMYDGTWQWYSNTQWTTTTTPQSEAIRSSKPPYVRWGDALLVSERHLDTSHLVERTRWIVGDPLQQNLIISPEDGLFYNHDVLSVLQQQRSEKLTAPADESIPFLFRTDSQASEERLLTLLPLLKADSLLSTATLLHHGSLWWDALHTRNLSWYNGVLHAVQKGLRQLEQVSEDRWETLDFEVQLYILWTTLIADQEGLSPNSTSMRRQLSWLCGLSDTDIELDRALISHVRWMVTQSYWKHRSCTGTAQSLSEHAFTADTVSNIDDELQSALKEHRTYTLKPDAPLWQQFLLFEREKELRDRYVNLHLSLENNSESTRGLFHEWQIRPVQATLKDSESQFHVSGVGRLYSSTWQPWIQTLSAQSGDTINVVRTIVDKYNTPIHPFELQVGMSIQLHTTVQGLPSTPFCIRQWGSAGLANQPQEHHSCHTLDEQGYWSTIESTHVVYDGQYRLPATWVATETDIAHTATTWLRTKRLTYP